MSQEKPIHIPPDTLVKAPSGIKFTVISCDEVSLYKYLVRSTLDSIINCRTLVTQALTDIGFIENGLIWPIIRRQVLLMTRFHPIPEIEYVEQVVQPYHLSWVHCTVSERDILSNQSKMWQPPMTEEAAPFTPKHHQTLAKQSRQTIAMQNHQNFILSTQKWKQQECHDNYCPEEAATGSSPP